MNKSKFIDLIKSLNDFLKESGEMGLYIKAKKYYRLGVRAAFRGLWQGNLDYFDFQASMGATIRRGFTQAWNEGASVCGVKPNELTVDEVTAMQNEMANDMSFLDAVAQFIEQNSKANGGKLSTIMSRADLWIEAYDRVYNKAKLMACADKKLKWVLNPAEHCSSCLRLEGKVKRASFWQASGVYPKSWDKLDCKQGCKCALVETDEPLSRGPLPRLP